MRATKDVILKANYKRITLILAISLFVISVLVHQSLDYSLYRALRAVVCFSFLGTLFFLQKEQRYSPIWLFILLYGLSSLAAVWYEVNVVATVSMALNFLAVLVLIGAVLPKVNFRKMNTTFTVVFIVLVLFNGYLLFEFVEMIRGFTLSSAHYTFMLLSAMSFVLLGFLALLYNYVFSSKSTLIFVFSVFLLIFAEIFRGIGYYDFAYGIASVYIARGLLILSLVLMVHYCLMDKNERELLATKLI